MLEKIGLTKEQINAAIKIWFWTVGFIFAISLLALILTWKEMNIYLILTVIISGILFFILIWKYPEKEKILEDYSIPEESNSVDFAKKELNEDQENQGSGQPSVPDSPVSNQDKIEAEK